MSSDPMSVVRHIYKYEEMSPVRREWGPLRDPILRTVTKGQLRLLRDYIDPPSETYPTFRRINDQLPKEFPYYPRDVELETVNSGLFFVRLLPSSDTLDRIQDELLVYFDSVGAPYDPTHNNKGELTIARYDEYSNARAMADIALSAFPQITLQEPRVHYR